MKWFHRKVAGHPTCYELECFAYMAVQDKVWGRQAAAWINPRALGKMEFTNEFLGEPVPPEKVTKTVIPRSRSCGKSEDIR